MTSHWSSCCQRMQCPTWRTAPSLWSQKTWTLYRRGSSRQLRLQMLWWGLKPPLIHLTSSLSSPKMWKTSSQASPRLVTRTVRCVVHLLWLLKEHQWRRGALKHHSRLLTRTTMTKTCEYECEIWVAGTVWLWLWAFTRPLQTPCPQFVTQGLLKITKVSSPSRDFLTLYKAPFRVNWTSWVKLVKSPFKLCLGLDFIIGCHLSISSVEASPQSRQ